MAQAKRKSQSAPVPYQLVKVLQEAVLVMLVAVACYLILALLSYDPADPGWSHTGVRANIHNIAGAFGAWFADIVLYLFGFMAYLVPVMVAYSGWLAIRPGRAELEPFNAQRFSIRWAGFFLLLLAGCGLGAFIAVAPGLLPQAENGAGGILGNVLVVQGLARVFGEIGTKLLLLAVFFASITLFTGLSWLVVMDTTGRCTLWLFDRLRSVTYRLIEYWQTHRASKQAKTQRVEALQTALEKKKAAPAKAPRIEPVFKKAEQSEREFKEKQITLFDPAPETELPPLKLLDAPKPSTGGYSKEALEAMSRLVEHKLQDFGITVEVVAVHPGPVITRFELQPAPGIKVSQISNLSKDLARSLSVVSVRVVEVIPGKSTVGLEIPNEERELVTLGEVIRSGDYESTPSPVLLALGKDIGGKPVVADLARMPHLLVAGTTGSGKSIAINAMLLSLLYKATPKDVRLVLIDPKMLELNIYEGIPHLLAPVVTDMKESANAMRWCVAEMERRYKLMAALGVRNITGYNRKLKDAEAQGKSIEDPLYKPEEAFDPEAKPPLLTHMPFIVVMIDEYADMMLQVGKKVEELITRLAQKARAAGIHLILATQRPSVDVITGLIKANIPCRIAFQVSSKVDSRTILDQMGAEQLLGRGDMLFMPPGTSIPMRVHGAFVDDHEVHRVVAHLKKSGQPDYIDIVREAAEPIPGLSGEYSSDEGGEKDNLYDEAVAIVTETRKASISYVQRRLKIGYNRAARMLEEMESAGIVSSLQANGTREVLAPAPPKV
ncbi:MAG TPA: DNA translocase FtsK 4TM domain-containing protein [Gammaproteobacteria bacterium]|nr:DNA translocase FtsK 4TM domain-containing protein [Gammaproteobacteria bacterium]